MDKRAYLAWINLREWVKRKKDAAVARYKAYRERVSKIEHAPQPPAEPAPPKPIQAAPPAPPKPETPRRPCDAVYTPTEISETEERIRIRGYAPSQVSRMMTRPVPGWDGWQLARIFEAEYPHADHYSVQEARDPEGRLLMRFAR